MGHVLLVTSISSAWLTAGDLVDVPVDDGARALALRARAGERAALRAVYERYARRVRRFVRDLLRDSSAADDALQDTFVRVFQRIGTLEAPEQLPGFVFGVARRVCLEHRRRAARRQRHDGGAGVEVDVVDSEATPEAAYLGDEAARALDRAVDALSPDRRAILLLRCDHLLPYDQIATAMGFSVAKVRVELHRARTTLAAVLQEEGAR